MVGAPEYLALFGDRMDDGLQRRATIGDAEPARLDLLDDLTDAPPDGPEILQPFIPQEPRPIGGRRIVAPLLDKLLKSIRHAAPTELHRRPSLVRLVRKRHRRQAGGGWAQGPDAGRLARESRASRHADFAMVMGVTGDRAP